MLFFVGYGIYIYFIIFFMGSKPSDLDYSKIKYNSDDQSEFVTHNIENYPIIAHQAGISIFHFDFIEIVKFRS